MGYGSYYGSSMNSGVMAVAASGVLAILAVIAVIVLTILACIKFLGKNGDRTSRLGRLFNFDHLFIETIIKVFYIMSFIGITVFLVWLVITSALAGGIVGFFGSLLGSIVAFFVLQFLCRLSFEMTMAFIRMSSDAHAIRKAVVGEEPAAQRPSGPSLFDSIAARIPKQPTSPTPPTAAPTSSTASPSPSASYSAAPTPPMAAPAPQPPLSQEQAAQAQPAPAPSPENVSASSDAGASPAASAQPNAERGAWTCPLCGKTDNTAKFCPKCGCARPEGQ